MSLSTNLPLRTKLIIFLCAVSLLPLFLCTRVLIGLGGRSFLTLREMQVREGLDHALGSLQMGETRLFEACAAVADWDELQDAIDHIDINWFTTKLASWAPQSYKLDFLAICDSNHHCLQQWHSGPVNLDDFIANLSSSFDTTRQGLATSPSDIFLVTSSPIIKNNTIRGHLIFGRRITHQFLLELRTNPGQNVMVYYGGKLLATTDTSSTVPYIDPAEIFSQLVQRKDAYLYHAKEQDQLLGFVPLKNVQGLDVAAIGWTSVSTPALYVRDAVNKTLLTFGIPLLALVLLAALFLGIWIERPIRELSIAMNQIRRTKDLSQRVPVSGGGEISLMSQTFNHLLDELAKKYEELVTFRTMILTMKEGVLIEDIQQKIIYMNPRMEEMLGIDFKKDGEELQKYLLEGMMTTKGERITSESGFFTEAVEWLRWDGIRVQALKTTGHLEDPPGTLAGTLSTFVDVTERNELEIELIEASRMAFLGLYSQGIIHNLSGPLNSVLGFSSLLCKGDPQAEIPNHIFMETQRMTDQIRTLGRRWQRTGAQSPELLNLNEILEDNATFLEADLFFKHNVYKHLELDAELPLVLGRYGDFSHGLMNIMINSIDALRDNPEPHFTIRTRSDKSEVQIEIEDNGVGISEENLSKIFLPFFSTKRRDHIEGVASGAGLGLPIARKVLEPYGVYFDVKSKSGFGSCFTLIIPLNNSNSEQSSEQVDYQETTV
jgi:signal transduction histidine kinase/HAMP domain-containing protein